MMVRHDFLAGNLACSDALEHKFEELDFRIGDTDNQLPSIRGVPSAQGNGTFPVYQAGYVCRVNCRKLCRFPIAAMCGCHQTDPHQEAPL
jgi:hypothetical protein